MKSLKSYELMEMISYINNIVTSGISVRDSLPLPMDILPQEL